MNAIRTNINWHRYCRKLVLPLLLIPLTSTRVELPSSVITTSSVVADRSVSSANKIGSAGDLSSLGELLLLLLLLLLLHRKPLLLVVLLPVFLATTVWLSPIGAAMGKRAAFVLVVVSPKCSRIFYHVRTSRGSPVPLVHSITHAAQRDSLGDD